MVELKEKIDPNLRLRRIAAGSMLVGLFALALSVWTLFRSATSDNGRGVAVADTSLSAILTRGTLRAGYGGFPPYTVDDPRETNPTARIKGFSVDLIQEISRRAAPPLKV